MLSNITDIKHVFYINLESRSDRKQSVINELGKIGLSGTRFNAIKMVVGAIGCSMSHLEVLKMAKQNDYDHVVIVEDDIYFTNPELFKRQLNIFLSSHQSDWDVVLLGGNNNGPYKRIDDSCVRVCRCQTTTGYIVQKHYYDILINNIQNGLNGLMLYPNNDKLYAIDQYWFNLQSLHRWFLITPLTVIQKSTYSDIGKKVVNYTNDMLTLEPNIPEPVIQVKLNVNIKTGITFNSNKLPKRSLLNVQNIGRLSERKLGFKKMLYT